MLLEEQKCKVSSKAIHLDPPTRLTMTRIRNKFEAVGTCTRFAQDRSGRRRIISTLCETRKADGKFSQKSKKPIEMLIVACDSKVSRQQFQDNNIHQFENMRWHI